MLSWYIIDRVSFPEGYIFISPFKRQNLVTVMAVVVDFVLNLFKGIPANQYETFETEIF